MIFVPCWILGFPEGPFSLTMFDLLLDISLQQLPDDYLDGVWQVAARVLNRNDPSSPLAQATHLLLTPDLLETQATAPDVG